MRNDAAGSTQPRLPTSKKFIPGNLRGVPELHATPFTIDVPEATLSDLRERIRSTRWPPPSPEPGWAQGTELEYLRGLLYWADGFDWREQERRLNGIRSSSPTGSTSCTSGAAGSR